MKNRFLSNVYNGSHCYENIDWEFINRVPEMVRLHECEQNPVWHSEGNAFKHTQLACEKLENEVLADWKFYFSCNEYELTSIRIATLLHDIGKVVTFTFPDKPNISVKSFTDVSDRFSVFCESAANTSFFIIQ